MQEPSQVISKDFSHLLVLLISVISFPYWLSYVTLNGTVAEVTLKVTLPISFSTVLQEAIMLSRNKGISFFYLRKNSNKIFLIFFYIVHQKKSLYEGLF